MISSKYDIVLEIGLVFLLLTISFAGEGRFDVLAQGTNATTNSTDATSGINSSSGISAAKAGEITVVMPLGSSKGSVSDALKYVTQMTEQLTTQQQKIEDTEAEETMNGLEMEISYILRFTSKAGKR
jgi:hypothetical protein